VVQEGEPEGQAEGAQGPIPLLPLEVLALQEEGPAQRPEGGGYQHEGQAVVHVGHGHALPQHHQAQLVHHQGFHHHHQHVEPRLLLRRDSVSSLDECSQRDTASSVRAAGARKAPGSAGPPPYANPYHPRKALEGLRDLRRAGLFTDVVLSAGGRDVPAHKSVLAACSPYFYAMFTSFEESRAERVELREVEPEALYALVDYVYTAKINVKEDNVTSLLKAADLLQLDDVRDACCDFLHSQLHPSNCLGIKHFADVHGCGELREQALAFIENRASEVLEGEEFLQLAVEQVVDLIKSDTLNVVAEERVYESVMVRIAHRRTGRILVLRCG